MKHGVRAQWWRVPNLRPASQVHSQVETDQALQVLLDYERYHAVKRLPNWDGYLVPWFLVTQVNPKVGVKHRLVTNMKLVNSFQYPTPKFRLDGLHQIFPCLRQGMYAASIDIVKAYFHLPVHSSLQDFCVIKVGDQYFQFLGAPFGLSQLPYIWDRVMKTFETLSRSAGFTVFVYLDDILILGASPEEVKRGVAALSAWLHQAGIMVNAPKSQLEPVQCLEHLGMELDFASGRVNVPLYKQKAYRRELGKLLTKSSYTVRKLAAILGKLRSLIVAIPALRAFSCLLQDFVAKRAAADGWDSVHRLPERIREEVRKAGLVLTEWAGRPMQGRPATKQAASDSSDLTFGGLDLQSGAIVHGHWTRRRSWHINAKELEAACETVRQLAAPGDRVRLLTDNTVAFSYLAKSGGKKAGLNRILLPFLDWCQRHQVTIEPEWVPTDRMPADFISRWVDHSDKQLQPRVYQAVKSLFRAHVRPLVDVFASPQSAQEPLFIGRWPYAQALAVDALRCPFRGCRTFMAAPPGRQPSSWGA